MNLDPNRDEAGVMDRHGIRRSLIAQYLYKEYRYSQLSDAVAQAERDERRDPGRE